MEAYLSLETIAAHSIFSVDLELLSFCSIILACLFRIVNFKNMEEGNLYYAFRKT